MSNKYPRSLRRLAGGDFRTANPSLIAAAGLTIQRDAAERHYVARDTAEVQTRLARGYSTVRNGWADDLDLLIGEHVMVRTLDGDEHVFAVYRTYASLADAVADGALALAA